jgi:hypothetical protein
MKCEDQICTGRVHEGGDCVLEGLMIMHCHSIMIAESGREWWGQVDGSGEKETHTEFLYKILKGIAIWKM